MKRTKEQTAAHVNCMAAYVDGKLTGLSPKQRDKLFTRANKKCAKKLGL